MKRLLCSLLVAAIAACKPAAPPASPAAKADDDAALALARISAKAAAKVGIALAKAEPASIAETLPLYGSVKPDAERTREVVARYPGTIRTVSVKVGDAVPAGEVLATVESSESLQVYSITAPIAGIVTAREADPGEQTGADVLFKIADPNSVWIELGLFPADVAKVRPGQIVQLASVDGGLHASAKIDLVGAFGGAPIARLRLLDRARRWTPGLYVNGLVELARHEAAVTVAASAIQRLDEREVVFVPVAGGFAPRAVRSGRADPATVEIVEGLKAGEDYVAQGSFIVKAELGKQRLEAEDDDGPDEPPATTGKPEADDAMPAPAASKPAAKDDNEDDKPAGTRR